MSEPLDELYFRWLGRLVADSKVVTPRTTYRRLLKLLYCKEFVWIVPHDGNRCEDGKDLRYEFVDSECLQDVDLGWMKLGCSMLEMLIALSRKLAFNAEGEPCDWFWHMIDNAGLARFNDRRRYSDDTVDDILERLIWRNYDYSGDGGFFPLQCADRDQRGIELLHQMNAYVGERI